MSDMRTLSGDRTFVRSEDSWPEHPEAHRHRESSTKTGGWPIVGIAALALGAWTLYHFGPDFRRYIKIKSM